MRQFCRFTKSSRWKWDSSLRWFSLKNHRPIVVVPKSNQQRLFVARGLPALALVRIKQQQNGCGNTNFLYSAELMWLYFFQHLHVQLRSFVFTNFFILILKSNGAQLKTVVLSRTPFIYLTSERIKVSSHLSRLKLRLVANAFTSWGLHFRC